MGGKHTCSMPGLSGLNSGLVSTCSGTSLQPTLGISSQCLRTVRARSSSVCFFRPAEPKEHTVTRVRWGIYLDSYHHWKIAAVMINQDYWESYRKLIKNHVRNMLGRISRKKKSEQNNVNNILYHSHPLFQLGR